VILKKHTEGPNSKLDIPASLEANRRTCWQPA
jgi:hypothetical protein